MSLIKERNFRALELNEKFGDILELIIRQNHTLSNLKRYSARILKEFKNSRTGNTLLHLCSIHGNFEVAEYLVKIGCNVNAVNTENEQRSTPLSLALTRRGNQKIVELLLANYADVYYWPNVVGLSDHLIFGDQQIAATFCAHFEDKQGYQAMSTAEKLFGGKWNLNAVICLQNDEVTASWVLLEAASVGAAHRVYHLLRTQKYCPASLTIAMKIAAKTDHEDSPFVLRMLLDNGAKVNTLNGQCLALRKAIIHGCVDNAKILLDHGAKFYMVNIDLRVHSHVLPSYEHFNPKNYATLLMEMGGSRKDTYYNHELLFITGIDTITFLKLNKEPKYFNETLKYMARISTFEDIFKQLPVEAARIAPFSFYHACRAEIENMQSHKLNDYTTLHDVFVKSIDEMVPYTRNKPLMTKLESAISNFPIYSYSLSFKIEKARQKRRHIDESIDVLSRCLPIVGSCRLIVDKIVFYLGVPNLLIFK